MKRIAIIKISHNKAGELDGGRSPEQYNWTIEFNDCFWTSEKRGNRMPLTTVNNLAANLKIFLDGFLEENEGKVNVLKVEPIGEWNEADFNKIKLLVSILSPVNIKNIL